MKIITNRYLLLFILSMSSNQVLSKEIKFLDNTCLDVPAQNFISGVQLSSYECNSSLAQDFEMNKGEIKPSYRPDLCFDIPAANFSDGEKVQLWQCNGTKAQRFDFVSDTIRPSANTDLCLDKSTGDVTLSRCDGSQSQKFLTETKIGTYPLIIFRNGQCLDITNENLNRGTKLQVWECNVETETLAQDFYYYKNSIRPVYAENLCMDIPEAAINIGAEIQLWDCNNTKAQQFAVLNHSIRPLADTSLCLDGSSGKMLLQRCDGNVNQQLLYTKYPMIFDGLFRSGNRLEIKDNISDLNKFNFNDRLISFNIPEGWELRFYDDANYRGNYYTRDSHSLDSYISDFKKQTSSIQVLKKPASENDIKPIENKDNIYTENEDLSIYLLKEKYNFVDSQDLINNVLGQNKNVTWDTNKGLISIRDRFGGFLGLNLYQITSLIYGKEHPERWEVFAVQQSLENLGIDTIYPYGSLQNIKSSIYRRIANTITKDILDDNLGTGTEPFILDAIQNKPSLQHLNIKQMIMDLLYNTYDYSNDIDLTKKISAAQPKVKLFSDYNYRGYEVDLEQDVSQLVVKGFNDSLSSYQIPKGWTAVFYKHEHFNGKHITRTGNGNIPHWFNDDTSSVRITKNSEDGTLPEEIQQVKKNLFDNLNNSRDYSTKLNEFSTIIDYENNEPVYGLPLTDEYFAKSQLYKYGADKKFVDAQWWNYMHFGKVSLIPNIRAPHVKSEENKFLKNYSITTTAQNLWHKKYAEIVSVLAKYISSVVDLDSTLKGYSSFDNNHRFRNNIITWAYAIKHYQMGNTDKTYMRKENVDSHNWLFNTDYYSKSILMRNNLLDNFNPKNYKFVDKIDFNTRSNNYRLFGSINGDKSSQCNYYQDGWYPKWNACTASYIKRGYTTQTDQQALGYALENFFIYKRDDLKSVLTVGDIVKSVLQMIVPIWGTVEDIQKGNTTMAAIGVITDVMTIIPIAGAASDVGKFTVKAINKATVKNLAPKLRTLGIKGIGVLGKKNARNYVLSIVPDPADYAKFATQSLKKLGSTLNNELNPLAGLSSLATLPKRGIEHVMSKISSKFCRVSRMSRSFGCDLSDVSEVLDYNGFDASITTKDELEEAIRYQYGDDIYKLIEKNYPIIKDYQELNVPLVKIIGDFLHSGKIERFKSAKKIIAINKTSGLGDDEIFVVADELSKLPESLLDDADRMGIKVILTNDNITTYLPQYKGQPVRGHDQSVTWDSIPGIGGTQEVVVSFSKDKNGNWQLNTNHGSISLVLHEFGHSVDHILGSKYPEKMFHDQYQFRLHWRWDYDKGVLGKYYTQPENNYYAAFDESFAEGLAKYYSAPNGNYDWPYLSLYFQTQFPYKF